MRNLDGISRMNNYRKILKKANYKKSLLWVKSHCITSLTTYATRVRSRFKINRESITTLNLCGVHPDALLALILELRREMMVNDSLPSSSTSDSNIIR